MKRFSAVSTGKINSGETTAAPMTKQRRLQIAEFVEARGSARVSELAEAFDTSEVTIRSDLARLERDGRLLRDRGGAIANERALTSLLAVEERAHLHLNEKRRIARAAVDLVQPGDTVLLDAGTTVVEMVPLLAKVKGLTLVTNALNVALKAGAMTDARVILLGGTLNRESSSNLGPMTEQQLANLSVRKLFLGTQALNLDAGLTDTTIEIAQIKQRMIQSARDVILLTDSSKWDKTGFIKVAGLDLVHTLICDDGLPKMARAALAKTGLDVVLV